MSLIKKLEEYFATTPREKVLEDWEKSEDCDKVGPTLYDYNKLLESIKVKLNKKHGDYII